MKSSTIVFIATAALLCGCKTKDEHRFQGYVEGEFVYVAAPLAGQLQTLAVSRGTQVSRGAMLFTLDDTAERAQREGAVAQLAQAQASARDMRKGQRPTELDALQAQYGQAVAALSFAESELARQQKLFVDGHVTSRQDVDRAQTTRDQARDQTAALAAQLKTARLGARADQVSAAEANRDAMQAQLAHADWALQQKRQTAPLDALVSDTLYREGEWVPAGRPVVTLLSPANIKVRAYVPQNRLQNFRVGSAMLVHVDGVTQSLQGKVNFISPQMEFTPPMIYSQENRSKFVTLIEIIFDPQVAVTLQPGQPVDVELAR